MSFLVGSGFLTAEISDLQINNIWEKDALPHLSLWEKIKDFFFSTHQQEVLQLIFDLYHPSPNSTPEKVKEIWEQLKQLASPGYKSCLGYIDSNSDTNNFTVKDITLAICVGEEEYTIFNGPISLSLKYKD